MAAVSTTDLASADKLETHKTRQARIYGFVLIGLAALVAIVFALESAGEATFRLSHPRDTWVVPNLVVPAAPFNFLAAAVLALLGVRQFMRGGSKWSMISIAAGCAMFVLATLCIRCARRASPL